MVIIFVNNAVIKGYHEINNTPTSGAFLNVDFENGDFGPLLVSLVTKPHNASDCQGRVPFGYVPEGLATSFKRIINQCESISAIATGNPCGSYPPWPEEYLLGGDMVIPCNYIIKTNQRDFCLRLLEAALYEMPEGIAMTLSVSET